MSMKAETTSVLLPATVCETGVDKDIELECALADYLPNINRIIRADADIVCEDVSVTNGRAEVVGKAVFSLLYESDFKQKLHCESFETGFNHSFDLKDIPDAELYPAVSARCSYVGCKTLNPRRLILRCRADIGLEVKCMQSVSTVSMQDTKGAYFKTEKRKTAVYCPRVTRDFNMEESVSLETLPPVGDIIYTTLELGDGEVSVSEGTALIRAEAVFKCLYEKEDEDGLTLAVRRFPVTVSVDDECIRPDSDIKTVLGAKNVSAEKDIDAYGENRIIRLRYGVRAELECVNHREIELPTDMFFEEYESENKSRQFPYETPSKELKHRFVLEKVFEIPDMALDNCLDVNAEATVTEAVRCDGGISVKGSCGINVFGGAPDGYRAQDCSAAFSEIVPFSADAGAKTHFKVTARTQAASADVSSGRLSVHIPVTLCITAVTEESVTALEAAEIERCTADDTAAKPIIVYYPRQGESAWDIGRRYHTNPTEIIESNADCFDKNGTVVSERAVLYM